MKVRPENYFSAQKRTFIAAIVTLIIFIMVGAAFNAFKVNSVYTTHYIAIPLAVIFIAFLFGSIGFGILSLIQSKKFLQSGSLLLLALIFLLMAGVVLPNMY